MHNTLTAILRLTASVCLLATIANANAAPPLSPEDRYIATRDAAIKKFSGLADAGRFDDAAEGAARADLAAALGK